MSAIVWLMLVGMIVMFIWAYFAILDEVKRDQFYYRIYVRTNRADLTNKAGKLFPILPGMVASVEIKIGQKTVLDYLIKPLNKVKESLR